MSGNLPAWREQCRAIGKMWPERLPSLVTGGLTLGVAGLGIWLCAGLIAPIFAVQSPLPLHFAERDPGEVAARLNRGPLFAGGHGGEGQAASVNNVNGIELLGVVSPPASAARPPGQLGAAWAVLRSEGEGSRLLAVGEELRPGLRLLRVGPEGVVFEGGGAVRSQFEITLRRGAGGSAAGLPATVGSHGVEVRKVIETNDM